MQVKIAENGRTDGQRMTTLELDMYTCSTLKQSHMQNFSSICQTMEKSVENCVKRHIFYIQKVQKEAKFLQKLIESDDTRT